MIGLSVNVSELIYFRSLHLLKITLKRQYGRRDQTNCARRVLSAHYQHVYGVCRVVEHCHCGCELKLRYLN